MIVYSVQCSHGHVFDEWFSNSADYDAKAAAGEITCPDCGDLRISKAIMAPRVAKTAEPSGCAAAGTCQDRGCAFANNF